MSYFEDPDYGITTTLEGVEYDEAVEQTTEALENEGFGVLTTIDVSEVLEQKLGVQHRDYVILGACNPELAEQALEAVPSIGLLLPCNVVVTENDDGDAVVSAIDASRMFEMVDDENVQPIAGEVRARLERVVTAVSIG